ncbi:MAG TPA: sigma-70 family RNA polymerase sigma factor [Longimicrobiales bacterium]|nr:sigma-70 family RNA polymerase sigma factor [Longimicrobiales bacterium]
MPLHHDDRDVELMHRLRGGDTAALDEALRRYWSPVVAYLLRICDESDVAEDVAQRTFLRLWERRSDWRPDGSLRGLLFRVARNIAISEYRSELARERAEAVNAAFAVDPPTPLALRESEELRDALDRAIEALPTRRREVFVLRCIHELSYREIAEIMGISTQTVANQLSAALATLRATLGPLLDD